MKDLVLVDDFLSEEEERTLLGWIDSQSWNDSINTRTTSTSTSTPSSSSTDSSEEQQLFSVSRRVQHYGFAFNYKTRNIDPEVCRVISVLFIDFGNMAIAALYHGSVIIRYTARDYRRDGPEEDQRAELSPDGVQPDHCQRVPTRTGESDVSHQLHQPP